ncbi:hypothetical protein HYX11_04320 [Candidatus Woesearchaeota archaeon]|nr:hypothetical protein [Candidatus Woesearchaeota archaeon]
MCNLKEAQRQEKLAMIFQGEGNKDKAIEHYIEAASIYVLNAELLKKDKLIENANICYKQAQLLRGDKDIKDFSKQELARRTIMEGHRHQGDVLREIEQLLRV